MKFHLGGSSRSRACVATLVAAVVASILVVLPNLPARAAGVGDVDGGFGIHGTVEKDYGGIDIAQAAVVDAAGRIVTVGWSQDTPDHGIIGRTLPADPTSAQDGTAELGFRDPSFAPGAPYAFGDGFQMIDDIPFDGATTTAMATRFTDVAIDKNGRIVIVGTVQDGAAPAARQGLLMRLNPNGSLDTTFGNGGSGGLIFDMAVGATDNQVQGVTLDQAGRILVAGAATLSGSQRAAVARFVDPGGFDGSFGSVGRYIDPSANTNAAYTDIAIHPTNLTIYAVGTGFNGTDTDAAVTRLTINGAHIATNDFTFGDAGQPTIATAAKFDSAQNLIVVGRAQRSGATVGFVTRFITPGLTVDTAWTGGPSARTVNLAGAARTSFEGLTIQPDDTYVIVGQLGTGAGADTFDVGLYALTAASPPVVVPLGDQLSTTGLRRNERVLRHGAAINSNIRDIVTQADGKVVVLGDHIHNVLVRFLTSPVQGTDAGSPVLSYSGDGLEDSFGMSAVHKLVADADQTWLAGERNSSQFVVATQPAAGGAVTSRIDGIPKPGGGNFASSRANSIVHGLSGTLVAAGQSGAGANSQSPTFVRFNADGSLDPTFGTGGVAVVPRTNPYDSADNMVDDVVVNDVAVLPDGKIVGVGFWQTPSGDPQDLYVVRLNADGSLDPTFDASGEYHGSAANAGGTDDLDGVVVNPDGSFVAVGREQTSPGVNEWVVVVRHYAANGALLTVRSTPIDALAVPSGPNSMQVHGAGLGPDGRIYVVGDFGGCTNSSDRAAFALAYKSDAQTLDANFGSGGLVQYCTNNFETGFGIAVAPNGDVVLAGGSGPSAQNASLTRYDSAGHPDMSFGVASAAAYIPSSSTHAQFESVGIRDDGTIVAAGAHKPAASFVGLVAQVVGDPAPTPTDFGPTGRVVFDSNQSGHSELWAIDSSGARLEQVTTSANQPGRSSADPTFSPDGREIAFTSVSDTNAFDANVRKRNAAGAFVDLAGDVTAYEADADWSADGTKIAFVSDGNGPSYGNLGVQPFDIWTMNADGTGKTRITNTADFDQFPAWSADGSKVLFQRSNGGTHDLFYRWMTGPLTGTLVQVTSGIDAYSGSWGPNGEIVFTDATVRAPRTSVCYLLPNDASFTTFHETCSASAPVSNEDANSGVFVPTSDPARPATVQYTVGSSTFNNRLDSINSTDGTLRTIYKPEMGLIGQSDWVENLKVSTSTTAMAASPASIPVGYVPIQSDAAAIKGQFDGAGLPNLTLLKSGLLNLTLLKSGLPFLTLLKSPLPNLTFLKSGLPFLTLLKSPLPNLTFLKSGLPFLTLLKSPVANGLRQTSLAELTLERPGGWQQFNADIPELASSPAQSLTLYDELKALQAHPNHATFRLQELSYQGTPFGQVERDGPDTRLYACEFHH